MVTGQLRMAPKVYGSVLVRALTLTMWLRVNIYSLTIISCQYANCLGLTFLLLLEQVKLFATVYAQLKYRYLKSGVSFCMEVSQSLFLSAFFVNIILLSQKRFDETVSDLQQDTGVWIVIVSCVIEYVLLIGLLGMGIWNFIKDKKEMKRRQTKYVKYSLIKYEENNWVSSLRPLREQPL